MQVSYWEVVKTLMDMRKVLFW